MKKLLKSEICRSREQCTDALFTGKSQQLQLEKKRKKEEGEEGENTENAKC